MKQFSYRRSSGIGMLAALALLVTACAGAPAEVSPSASGEGPAIEQTTLTFSHSAAVPQLEKVPIHLAVEDLGAVGITGTETFHQNGEDAVQAVARGESDFGVANAPTVFAAIKKGAPIKAVMTAYFPAYLVVATADVDDACDLDGKRIGIHSQISATTLYTNLALKECKSAEPEILVVPGSAARVQAMLAGQLDASAVQFSDWLALEAQAPGKFKVIYDVAKEDLGVIDSVIFTNQSTLDQKPEFVRAFLSTLLATYKSVYEDEAAFAAEILATIPDMTEENAAALAKTSIEDRIWPEDGGFDDERIKTTLAALAEAELLTKETLPDASQCCTSSFIE